MRVRVIVSLAVAIGLAVAAGASAAEPPVVVYFTRGEQLATVHRTTGNAAPLDAALAALFAGPTRREAARAIKTAIPPRARLHSVRLRDGVATVNVTRQFVIGSRSELHARLAQVVFTATATRGVDRVRFAVDGGVRARIGGLIVARGIGRSAFAPTPVGGTPAPPPPEPYSPLVRQAQERLIALRYLPVRSDDGLLGEQTRHAILAFQGWQGLRRDGRVTRRLLDDLRGASPPRARGGSGRRIEVSISRQVALLVDGSRVIRAIHVSTGGRGFDTPRGSFRVFRKELRSWSYPYRVWLPYASYFTGGVAFHESRDVPAYPASHGCVRVPSIDAPLVYAFASIGTRVVVS